MELRHLRYFLAIAETGNFTRAAQKLGIAQPPLSQQIRALEDEVGVQLFHRVAHGAELTEAGRAFLVEAEAALAAAHRAKLAAARAHRGEIGSLALGFTSSSGFNPIISATVDAFHHAWPDVRVSLDEMNTMPLYERLLRDDLDAAFVRPSIDDPEEISLRHLLEEETVIALPANHPLAGEEVLRIKDLAKLPFILFPRTVAAGLHDEVVDACRKAGFVPIVAQEALRVASTINLVAAHLGVSIVPRSITQIALPGVVYRPIRGPAPVARLCLATRKGRISQATRNFLTLLPQEKASRAEKRRGPR